MDAETKARIFEPFFTTKAIGKGTGLGLASVYGAIRQMDGTIAVDSTPGAGTTFTILLPAVGNATGERSGPVREAASDGPPSVAHARGPRPRALLVDDEPAVRTVLQRLLERAGCDVDAVGDGASALALLDEALASRADEAKGVPWALLVSDVLMPGMSGLQLAARVRERTSTLPIVLMSGYPAEHLAEDAGVPEDVAFIPKPPEPAALRALVARVVRGDT